MVALLQPLTPNGMNQGDLYRWMQNVTAAVNELITNSGTNRANVQALQDDGLLGNPGLAITAGDKPHVVSAAFEYVVNGRLYNKAAVTAGTSPGTDVVPEDTFGAVALDIGSDGTIDVINAADNATGYASAALALADIPAVAANHVRMGTVTVTKSDGAFTFGTTDLDAANTTVAYADGATVINNLTAPAAIATAAISLA